MNTLILENNPEELVRLSQWIDSFASNHNIAEEITFKLELAVVEAVTNIIDYAYDDGHNNVSITGLIVDNSIVIELEDEGKPFNPLDQGNYEGTDNLDEAKVGGWGIHLIRNYTDDCVYQRENSTNRLKMTISL